MTASWIRCLVEYYTCVHIIANLMIYDYNLIVQSAKSKWDNGTENTPGIDLSITKGALAI